MHTQNRYQKEIRYPKKSYNIPIRYLLDSMAKGSILSYCTLINFNHKHIKDITNINKGKKIDEMI